MSTIDLANYQILVVDDVVFSRRIVTHLLNGMGYPRISVASGGADAIRVLRGTPGIDMVVSDFKMPVMNGLKLLKSIRTGEAGVNRDLPFAMLTGFSDRDLVDVALSLDVNAFLLKPVSHKAMAERLKTMLNVGGEEPAIKPAEAYGKVTFEGDEQLVPVQGRFGHPVTEGREEMLGSEDEPPDAPDTDTGRYMAKTMETIRKLATQSGNYDSETAKTLISDVNKLATDVGEANAAHIISYFDSLIAINVIKADELPTLLSQHVETSRQKENISPPPPPLRPPSPDWKETENSNRIFSPINEIPAGTTLARELKTLDGSTFIIIGTALTPQVVSILSQLAPMKILAFDEVHGQTGLYVTIGDESECHPEPLLGPAVSRPQLRKPSSEKQISLSEVNAGDIVSRNVYTANGLLYVGEGTPSLIVRFHRFRISANLEGCRKTFGWRNSQMAVLDAESFADRTKILRSNSISVALIIVSGKPTVLDNSHNSPDRASRTSKQTS